MRSSSGFDSSNEIFKKDTFDQGANTYGNNITQPTYSAMNSPGPINTGVPNQYPGQPRGQNLNAHPGNPISSAMGQGVFPSAFNPLQQIPFNGVTPKSDFFNNNFINSGRLLHNNYYENVLHEEIREYSILIDSKDRNYQVYPNPFSYKVTVNPLPEKRERINGKLVVTTSTPNPVINNSSLYNIRYIKLEDVVMPFYTSVKHRKQKFEDYDCQGHDTEIDVWKINKLKKTTNGLYNILMIDEFKDITSNIMSTNDLLSESFATIYFDQPVNCSHYLGQTTNGYKVFPVDQLFELKTLTIRFVDAYGKPLTVDHLDTRLMTNYECKCKIDDGFDVEIDTFEQVEYAPCHLHNFYHPLNPIFQNHIQLTIGVVQPNLNKQTFS